MRGGGRCTPLPTFLFAFYSKLSWGTHTLKCLTLQTFLLRMPLWKKKIKKFSFTPLSEHFEIWVWKPAMAERVKAIKLHLISRNIYNKIRRKLKHAKTYT